ncbi:MAG: hypothetical protein H0T51_10375 [Pirellulales bacterium]|nr:hypothetical protein [Pirellulales bacterium]
MNPSFTVRASTSWLHHERQRELAVIFPQYRPMLMTNGLGEEGDFPSSIYLQVVGEPAVG